MSRLAASLAFVTALASLSLSFSLSGCAHTSHEDVQNALDRAQKRLELTNASLQVSADQYGKYCLLRPDCDACKGETAETIRALLEMGPLTVGQIQDLLKQAQDPSSTDSGAETGSN
jgi:hypothetical protein